MNPPPWSTLARGAALLLAGGFAAMPAGAAPVHEGYDALWKTLPMSVFTAADERRLEAPQSVEGQEFRAWGPGPRAGGRLGADRHRVEILGPDITVDRRSFPFARASVFPDEAATEPGADARLFVGARDVCVQGTAPSSSGTAQRHVHVALVTDAFTRRAHRYDLPSLFGSCLMLTWERRGGRRFFRGTYHTPAGAQLSDGVDFEPWRLGDGSFSKATGPWLRIRFPDPDDVYRFKVVAP